MSAVSWAPLLTGVFAAPSLGGTGVYDYVANAVGAEYSIANQVWIQAEGVLITIVWSGVVSFIAFKLVDLVIGLRVSEEEEREGLGHLQPWRNRLQPLNPECGAARRSFRRVSKPAPNPATAR